MEVGSETNGNRPASNGIGGSSRCDAIYTSPASQAALRAVLATVESLVVVQAVAGSSPVAHPQGCKPSHSGVIGRGMCEALSRDLFLGLLGFRS